MSQTARLVRIEFDALPERLHLLRCVVRELTDAGGFAPERRDTVVLAINEACANIMQHAYADREAGAIVMEVLAEGDGLRFMLQDWGRSVSVEQLRPRPLEELRPGGLGMHFMRCILDDIEYHPSAEAGNRMLMYVRRECEKQP